MPLLSSSLDAFLSASLTVTVTCFLYSFVFPKYPGLSSSSSRTGLLRKPFHILVLLHTLFNLHALILRYPLNIFQSFSIPLTTPTEQIRTALLRLSKGEPLSDALEALLTKLGSYEVRTLYVRFGHDVISSCHYCHSYLDYALFAMPTTSLQYIRTAFFVGLLTLRGSGKERWRKPSVAMIILAAVCEAWWINSVTIETTNDPTAIKSQSGSPTVMWHDVLYALRHMLFLLLPLIIHFLLPARPHSMSNDGEDDDPEVETLLLGLERALRKAHLLKYMHGAVLREPALRERSTRWWAFKRAWGATIRTDEGIRNAARHVGWGSNDDGAARLRAGARMAVQRLLGSFIPEE